MCWLKPEQTAAKTHPYLFTQGQACLNRQFFPCQDTPAIKTTYRAVIAVPKGFTPVMAATMLNTVDESGKMVGETMAEFEGLECFRFEMRQPIPSYLVALAVRVRCWPAACSRTRLTACTSSRSATCDARRLARGLAFGASHAPSRLPRRSSQGWVPVRPACAWGCRRLTRGFAQITEKYIAAVEKLFGAYHWDVYDLLVMPPCFPYGGMENPRYARGAGVVCGWVWLGAAVCGCVWLCVAGFRLPTRVLTNLLCAYGCVQPDFCDAVPAGG